jgi:hypothetical protein
MKWQGYPYAVGQTGGDDSDTQTALHRRANAIDKNGVKIGEDFEPEKSINLIDNISDVPFDRASIIRPYFAMIFEEELNGWYRLESCAGRFAHPFGF